MPLPHRSSGVIPVCNTPHKEIAMREKPWTPRESVMYRDVKKAVASEAAIKERLRQKEREVNDLKQENATLARAFKPRSA